LLVTRDGDNKLVILGWTFCLTEDGDNYEYMADHVKQLPNTCEYMNREKQLLYSDRMKGINRFEREFKCGHANCIVHIIKNIRKNCGTSSWVVGVVKVRGYTSVSGSRVCVRVYRYTGVGTLGTPIVVYLCIKVVHRCTGGTVYASNSRNPENNPPRNSKHDTRQQVSRDFTSRRYMIYNKRELLRNSWWSWRNCAKVSPRQPLTVKS
jgi:hypothetical protein